MVAWWWIIVAFFIGFIVGMMVMALCAVAGQSDREMERALAGQLRPEHGNEELELIG